MQNTRDDVQNIMYVFKYFKIQFKSQMEDIFSQ